MSTTSSAAPSAFLTLLEAAEELAVSDESIRNYIKRGHLRAFKLPSSKLVRIRRTDLEAFIAAGEIRKSV